MTFRANPGPIRSFVDASLVAAAFLHLATSTASALPAFPGAEGFGSHTPGGRGGSVVEVTSLADDGPGSLRAALEDASGPRTVVFRVAGTITLASPVQLRGEAGSYVTIAGQTAPGDGIQLAVYGLQLRDGVHDVVIRYLRVRPGNASGDYVDDIDAIELWGNDGTSVRNVVIDHCSLQWAMDENFSSWADVADVTVQRSLLAEAQLDGQGHSVAKGALVGADTPDPKPDRFSFHHNVFAHNPDRNPRVAYAQTDFRNNVVYDWGGNSSTMFGPYAGPLGAKPTDVNLVGNVWKRGPASYPDYLDAVWLSPNTRVFPDDNVGTRCPSGCTNEWDLGFREEFGGYDAAGESYRSASAFEVPAVTTYPAASLVDTLIANVGASLPARDAVDARILADVLAGTGAAGQGSGYPTLTPAAAPDDADHDGMPDAWETLHGLSPSDADDRNDDDDADGYTNLEEYLAEIGPTEFGCGDGTQHPGEACDDANRTDGDGCDSDCTLTACGNHIVTSGEDCDGGACCSASCDFEPAATPCDDGRLCTSDDACDGAGACLGAETPAPSCLAAPKGSLQVDAARGRLSWKWQSGAQTSVAALGDPRLGGTTYALCLYDSAGGTPALAGEAVLPAGDANWDARSDGFKYRSHSGAPAGVRSLRIRAGEDGQAGLALKSGGQTFVPPPMPLAQDPSVTVQLRSGTGACWSQTYAAPASRGDGERFKDRAD